MDDARWEGRGKVMIASKSSKKLEAEMFDDLPILRRKWQAALRPGEKLPRYEDVMLGSLGRLACFVARAQKLAMLVLDQAAA